MTGKLQQMCHSCILLSCPYSGLFGTDIYSSKVFSIMHDSNEKADIFRYNPYKVVQKSTLDIINAGM